MRKFILSAFLLACVCAYPQRNNFDVTFDEITIKNQPNLMPKPKLSEKSVRDWLSDCTTTLFLNSSYVNLCADDLFQSADALLAQYVDPYDMPDLSAGFSYHLIITYNGAINLTNGQLKGFSSAHRDGDVAFSDSILPVTFKMDVPMSFNTLGFTYHYSAKIMGLGPTGGIEGTVTSVELEFGLSYNDNKFTLDNFTIKNSGHIDFKFTGNSLIDWLLNLLSDVVTSLLKKVILDIFEDVVGAALNAVVELINEALANGTALAVPNSEFSQQVYKAILKETQQLQ